MSGHSKWSTIKHKKGAKDKARSKVFTKLIRELTVAAKSGDPDPEMNPRLRLAIQRSKASNMPTDTIQKAVKRGAGDQDGADYVEGVYEGYGPGGVGLLVLVLTDNKNRTASDVRHIFSRYGGALGSPGSVAYNFNRVGQLMFSRDLGSEDDFMEHVLESGAEDLVLEDEEFFEVVCEAEQFHQVQGYFQSKNISPQEADLVYKPKTRVDLTGGDLVKMFKMLGALEDNDDVQNVFSSFDASEDDINEAMESL
jgi:YebC/PmpR family DNA-binding regulatory protein